MGSTKHIEQFERLKKRVFRELSKMEFVEAVNVVEVKEELESLSNQLMDLELRQVDHFEDIMGDFDSQYREIHTGFLDAQVGFFRQVEECENTYAKELSALANDLLDRASK